MPFETPDLKKLYQRVSADFNSRLLNGDVAPVHSVIDVQSKVWAGACHQMYGFLDWAFLQAMPDTASDEFLERWASIWSVFARAASVAAGPVQISGLNGASVPAGAYLYSQKSSSHYKTLAATTLSDGAATLHVQSLDTGAAVNLTAGEKLSFVEPQTGVQAEAVVLAPGLTGGVDAESMESLRQRMLLKIRQPPHGGNASDYVQWALEVEGVTRAWVYPLHLGLGTVGLTFLSDSSTNPESPLPDPETVARVQSHIDKMRPVTAFVEVFAPEALNITVSLSLDPDTESVRYAAEQELRALWQREAAPGCKIPFSHLVQAVSLATGEYDHKIHSPVGDIITDPGVYPRLSAVEFLPW